MRVISLMSGSKGNCTLVVTEKYNLLIDVGGSAKKINEQLMISYGIDLDDIGIIFITHSSHIDHINSVKTILNKYEHIKFYCSEVVYNELNEHFKTILDENRFIISSLQSTGKSLDITPFKLNHDKECQGYMISEHNGETYVHIADNGKLWDKDIIQALYNKEYYSIESNHDLTLQINDTKRHEGLKRRVLGVYGHTANHDAMELAFKLVGERTKGILFNHLSEHCNSVELASLTHDNLIGIWGKRTEFKNIKIKYALQDNIVEL